MMEGHRSLGGRRWCRISEERSGPRETVVCVCVCEETFFRPEHGVESVEYFSVQMYPDVSGAEARRES